LENGDERPYFETGRRHGKASREDDFYSQHDEHHEKRKEGGRED